MTVFHYGSKPDESHEQFFQRLVDAGEAMPDPTWDYATLWRNLGEVEKLTADLRALVSQQEERSPAIESAIDERLALIKAVIEGTIQGVPF